MPPTTDHPVDDEPEDPSPRLAAIVLRVASAMKDVARLGLLDHRVGVLLQQIPVPARACWPPC